MVIKKAKKNKTSPKSKKQKKGSVSRTDFETFKFGVERLKELEKELDSLDTRGFAGEEQEIKTKLKKVSEIPSIERQLKSLKLKINKKYKPKKIKKSQTKEEQKIGNLLTNLPKHGQIKEIKKGLEDIQEDLKKIKSRKIYKPVLSKLELEKIKEELKKIEKAHEKDSEIIKKSAKQKIHIDSGVDTLVDANFNVFLRDTKKALSERVEKKEREIDEFLKMDLEDREARYRKKHNNLLSDFENKRVNLEKEHKKLFKNFINEKARLEKGFSGKKIKLEAGDNELRKKLEKEYQNKFDEKVAADLQREISEKFREKLNKKFEEEKAKVNSEYKIELKRIARSELENQKQKLDEKARNKERMLGNKEEKEVKEIKEKLAEQSHRELEVELAKKEKILKSRLESEYDLRLKQELQRHEQEIKRKKLDLEMEMQKKIKQVLE